MPLQRLRFVATEAALAIMLHAGVQIKTDDIFSEILLWPRTDIPWGPLCSHPAMWNKPVNVADMTQAQIDETKALRALHKKERARRAYAFNRERHLESPKKRKKRERVKASRRFYCRICPRSRVVLERNVTIFAVVSLQCYGLFLVSLYPRFCFRTDNPHHSHYSRGPGSSRQCHLQPKQ